MAKERSLSFMHRLIAEATGDGLVVGNADDPAAARWPALWEWLSTTAVGVKYVKTPPALTINLIPGGITARISDRDLARNLEITFQSLSEVFDKLEEALQSPSTLVKIYGKREPHLRERKKR